MAGFNYPLVTGSSAWKKAINLVRGWFSPKNAQVDLWPLQLPIWKELPSPSCRNWNKLLLPLYNSESTVIWLYNAHTFSIGRLNRCQKYFPSSCFATKALISFDNSWYFLQLFLTGPVRQKWIEIKFVLQSHPKFEAIIK